MRAIRAGMEAHFVVERLIFLLPAVSRRQMYSIEIVSFLLSNAVTYNFKHALLSFTSQALRLSPQLFYEHKTIYFLLQQKNLPEFDFHL
jgi:hypothetical protein